MSFDRTNLSPARAALVATTWALLAMLGAPAQASSASASAEANSGTLNLSGPRDSQSRSGNGSQSAGARSEQLETVNAYQFNQAQGMANSNATALAGGAALKLSAHSMSSIGSSNGGGMVASASSSASGSWSDSFIILATGCSSCTLGSRGVMSFGLSVTGGLLGGGGYATTTLNGGTGGWYGSASWSFSGQINAGAVPNGTPFRNYAQSSRSETFSANQAGTITDTRNSGHLGVAYFTIEFIFGQPIALSMTGRVEAEARSAYDFYASQNLMGSSSASSDFMANLANTMGWAGITELRDANGNLVSDYSALSTDGSALDYRLSAVTAVPEPGAAALFAAGLAALLMLRRRAAAPGLTARA
jgi:hypothetical protein